MFVYTTYNVYQLQPPSLITLNSNEWRETVTYYIT